MNKSRLYDKYVLSIILQLTSNQISTIKIFQGSEGFENIVKLCGKQRRFVNIAVFEQFTTLIFIIW